MVRSCLVLSDKACWTLYRECLRGLHLRAWVRTDQARVCAGCSVHSERSHCPVLLIQMPEGCKPKLLAAEATMEASLVEDRWSLGWFQPELLIGCLTAPEELVLMIQTWS